MNVYVLRWPKPNPLCKHTIRIRHVLTSHHQRQLKLKGGRSGRVTSLTVRVIPFVGALDFWVLVVRGPRLLIYICGSIRLVGKVDIHNALCLVFTVLWRALFLHPYYTFYILPPAAMSVYVVSDIYQTILFFSTYGAHWPDWLPSVVSWRRRTGQVLMTCQLPHIIHTWHAKKKTSDRHIVSKCLSIKKCFFFSACVSASVGCKCTGSALVA